MSSAPMNTQNSRAVPQMAPAGLYVPVHRRGNSRGDAASATGSMTPSSPAASMRSLTPTEELESKSGSPLLPIYTIQNLLTLQRSPLVVFSQEQREKLRVDFPEILLNRRQRKSRAAREHQSDQETETRQVKAKEAQEPLSPMRVPQSPPRRTRPGRAPERRRNAKKIVEELSWRVPRTRTISANGTVMPMA